MGTDASTLTLFIEFQAACLLTLVLSFAFWFRLRDTTTGDLTCLVAATVAAAALVLSSRMLKPLGCISGVFQVPGLLVYLWFLGLRGIRRDQVRIRQWGRRHGYRVVTIERQVHSRRSAATLGPHYRILVRRKSDNHILVGLLSLAAGGIRVEWIPVPAKHVTPGHGPIAAETAPGVPNPPHTDPPPPS